MQAPKLYMFGTFQWSHTCRMKNGLPSVLLASTVAGRRPAPGTCWHSEMSPGWGWLLRLERCPKKERYSFVREMHQLAVSTYSPVLDSAAASKMVQNCLFWPFTNQQDRMRHNQQRDQCDQTAWLIFHILALYSNEYLFNSIKSLPKCVHNFAKY